MPQVTIENPILNSRSKRFPQLLEITRRWLRECVIYKDHTFPQLLLLSEFAHESSISLISSFDCPPAGRAPRPPTC